MGLSRDVKYILWHEGTGVYFSGIEPDYVRITRGLCLARMWKRKKKASKMALRLHSSHYYFVVREVHIDPNGDISLVDQGDGTKLA